MNSTKLYPLKFQPIFKYRIWGGNKLKNELQKNIDGDQIGESWEISDVSGDETLVMEGELKGYTLKKLIQEYKSHFLGQSVYENFGDSFPLLIKIIDANLPLSIQVHPGDEVAKKRHQSFGKNEMWYIMDAEEGAELIVGFKKQTTTAEYLSKLDKGEVLDLLNIEKVKSEDVFYIPSGRVHAIGAGVLLAEIQQTSDITYRIFDYDRVEASTGKKRELHNDLAKDVIDFNIYPQYKSDFLKIENTSNTLVHSPYFKSNFIRVNGKLDKDYTSLDSFIIYIAVNGSCEIRFNEMPYNLKKGESVLIPASLKRVSILSDNNCDLLEVYV